MVGSLTSSPALVQPHHSSLHAYHFNHPGASLTSSSFPGASRLLSRYPHSSPFPYPLQNGSEHYSYGVADGICEPYSFQSSQSAYVPNHDSSNTGAMFGVPENPRSWSSTVSHAGRPVPSNFDQESAQIRYPTSTLPYINPASAVSDVQSVFSGMASLASSLPSDDRVLPTPRTNNLPTSTEPLHGSSAGYFAEVSSTLGSRPQLSWNAERTSSVCAQNSHSMTSKKNSAVSTTSTKASSPEPQEPPFNYSTLQTTQPSPTSTMTSASEFAMTPTSASSSALDDQVLSGQPYLPDISSSYSYPLNGNKSQQPPALDNALLGSQSYTSLPRQGQPQRHMPLLDAHGRGSARDPEARSISRTSSIPSIGSTLR